MQTVSCPGCGAPVEFKSHASVMAVCEFCRTTVVKEAEAVRDLGKMSAVLEDYSPIQIGTAGVYVTRHYTVVGRIQLRYSAGIWNEWFLLFDDGATGWLGDSSGRFVVTTEREPGATWPQFARIRPGEEIETGVGRYIAAEKRTARCIGGQGELPFRVGEGWEARVADFRRGGEFLPLDYSDDERPTVYAGAALTLEQMQCQLLRDDEAIRASAGRYRGRVDTLGCPQCGAPISWLPGVTANLVCQSCRSQIDASTPQVAVLDRGAEVERHRFTLPLGGKGTINNREYRVLGAMVRVDEEDNRWTEYLLHNARAGFMWLVETEDEWWRSEVMDNWPAAAGAVAVKFDRATYTKLYDYSARVELAVGAFHWKVAVGDRALVSEYQHGPSRLASELTPEEFTWSRSNRVAYDQVRAWFRLSARELHAPAPTVAEQASTKRQTGRFILWLLGLNIVPMLLHFSGAVPWVVFGLLALALPPNFIKDE